MKKTDVKECKWIHAAKITESSDAEFIRTALMADVADWLQANESLELLPEAKKQQAKEFQRLMRLMEGGQCQ